MFYNALLAAVLCFPLQAIAEAAPSSAKGWRPAPAQLALDIQAQLGGISSLLPASGLASDLDVAAMTGALERALTAPQVSEAQLGAGLVLLDVLEQPEKLGGLAEYLGAAEADAAIADLKRWSAVAGDEKVRRALKDSLAPLRRSLIGKGAAPAQIAAIFDGSALRAAALSDEAPATFAGGSLKTPPRAAQLRRYRPSYAKMSAGQLGTVLSEDPVDPMGAEFRVMIGRLAATLQAHAGNLEELGPRIFSERLALAKKYGTPFAERESQYEQRWNGKGDQHAWSFGFKDKPRGQGIREAFQKNLKAKDGVSQDISAAQLEIFSPSLRPAPGAWKTWAFSYRRGGHEWEFPVHLSKDGNYYIRHANDAEIPLIRRELARLWGGVVSASSSPSERVRRLAEFEWLWYRANPFGRAGASVGDVLSVLLQKHLEGAGVQCRVRERFVNQDLAALSLPFDAYVDRRAVELYPAEK